MNMLRRSLGSSSGSPTASALPILVDDRIAGDPLGRDTGHDSACHRAAVAVFGVVGLAVVGMMASWLMLRGSEPEWAEHPALLLPGGSPVPADAPMLRPGFGPSEGEGFSLLEAEAESRVSHEPSLAAARTVPLR